MANFVILAHVLSPNDFGLAAAVAVVTSFGLLFTDLGIGSALIQLSAVTRDDVSSALWMNLGSGILLSTLLWFASPAVAGALQRPGATNLFRLGSLIFAVSNGAVPLALLERTLRMRRVFFCEVTAAVVGSAASVALAVAGFGASSLVAAPVITAAVLTAAVWSSVPRLPLALPSKSGVQEVWARSSRVCGFNTINYWARNTDNILLSRFASPANFAFYARAYSLMLSPISLVNVSVARVLLPAFARARRLGQDAGALYLRANTVTCAAVFPVVLMGSLCAPRIVPIIFGEGWRPMGLLLLVLGLSGPSQIVNALTGSLYQAAGQNSAMLRRGLTLSTITVLLIIATVHWGPMAMAVSLTTGSYLLLPYSLSLPLRYYDVSLRQVLLSLRGVLIASLSIVLIGLVFDFLLPGTAHAVPIAMAEVASTALVYLAVLKVAQPGIIAELLGMLRRQPIDL